MRLDIQRMTGIELDDVRDYPDGQSPPFWTRDIHFTDELGNRMEVRMWCNSPGVLDRLSLAPAEDD